MRLNINKRLSIKKRIYYSFYILASIFVVNGLIIVATISYNKKLSSHISEVVDPSVQSLNDFKLMLIQSREFSINWVFLRSNEEYKKTLKEIHNAGYPALNLKLTATSLKWENPQIRDSLKNMFRDFEMIIAQEKIIINSLSKFEDYDDPVKKFAAEEKLENVIIPQTNLILNTLKIVLGDELKVKILEENKQKNSATFMWMLISTLALLIVTLAIFLSLYMGRIIIRPINTIIKIVDDLGKGIINKFNPFESHDEMGEMIRSVNNLSEKLHSSALFANEIGNRNFNTEFVPLSDNDSLGKALITMRNNLKSSDENLNEAQHIAHIGNWEIDLINNSHVWSDEMYNIFGFNVNEFTPTTELFLSRIHPEDLDYSKEKVEDSFRTFQNSSFDFRLIRKDGIVRYGHSAWNFEFNKEGNPIRLFGIVQDVTERTSSELALRESKEQIQTIYNASLDAIIIIDEEGRIVKWDVKSEKLFGWSENEVMGIPLSEIIIPFEHREAHNRGMKKFLKTGSGPVLGTTIEVRALKKDNIEFDISLSIAPSFVKDKYQFIGFIRDITERKKAEESLQQSEANLQTIFSNANTGYILFDIELRIIFFNQHAQKYTVEELHNTLFYGKKATECFPIERKQFIEDTLRSVLKGNNCNYDVNCPQPDGTERWYSANYFPVSDKSKKIYGVIMSLTEFTERKKAEQVLEKQNNELIKTNAELDKFVYSVSHDLRAPLSSMLGVVQISEEETQDELLLSHLGMLKGSIRKLDGFISDILDYSRNSRIEVVKENINFTEMIGDITNNLKYMGTSNRNVKINVDIHTPVPFCSDKNRLSIIINNLVSNAIRYQNPAMPDPFVNIKVDTCDTETNIVIRDNGIGISKEMHEKIYDMFFRISEESVGSGLGLYIVQESVKKLNGHIEVESELGKGTTFNIHIPNC